MFGLSPRPNGMSTNPLQSSHLQTLELETPKAAELFSLLMQRVRAGLVKYYAEVKEGVLLFSWMDATQKKQAMRIELEGCSCRLVEESLGTKNVWWRKAPLEISHPERCLYQGSTSLFMFCMHGADKEQWLSSLSRYMDGGDSIKVIQHIYKRYSKRYRRKSRFPFPGSPATSTKSTKSDDKVEMLQLL